MKPRSGKRLEEKTVVVTKGTLLDRSFQPLQDVQRARRKHIPQLAHGLNEVLQREGVHWLRDPQTQKYNFPEYLETIPRVEDFAFDRLPEFTPSSRDQDFVASVKRAGCRFAGSTSSLTGILTQIYLLLSEEKSLNISDLSEEFVKAPRFFTPGQRIPSSVILRYQNGIYTTDYDGERDSSDPEEIILLPLGTLLEKFLTLSKDEFGGFLKSNTSGQYPKLQDVHRYAKYGKFLMRSQLDCYDKTLPGTGVFDLKTRAISAIRHDVHNYLNYINYKIESLTGREDSFESEYYDMIRSAFLEYSFQARIGNMDGVLVAYHNTARIFGFQYISLREMDRCLFGREDAGDRVFIRCVALMELLYEHITRCFPSQSVKVTFEKRSTVVRAWVEPLEVDGGEPPVVELQLHLQNIMHGRAAKGSYAIYADYPWAVQYRIERNVEDQATILRNRDRAYKRQLTIAKSLPTTREGPELEETFGVSDPAHSQSTVIVDEGTV
ncbi:mitochondrial protein Pet127-domain-containing protein [Cubamyces lactineus]|nr:mitochondrial protein Pet127-domain-containing protein [Cubamyces lactineus]